MNPTTLGRLPAVLAIAHTMTMYYIFFRSGSKRVKVTGSHVHYKSGNISETVQ